MKKLLVLLTCLCYIVCDAQRDADPIVWYKIADTLKRPHPKGSIEGYYPSIGSRNRYDSVPCMYMTHGGVTGKGYKYVYVYRGFYIDDKNTVGIIYDKNFVRLYNVEIYHFNP